MSTPRTDSSSEREIVLTRELDAPRALVWRLWTELEHLAHWWGPTGFTTTTHEHDVRPGGRWRFTFRGPDGTTYENLVTYTAVEAPARLAYRHGGEAGLEEIQFESEVTLEELGPARTRVTLRSLFPSAAARERVVRDFGAIEGGKQTLARMAERGTALANGTAPAGDPQAFTLQRVFAAPRAQVYELWTRVEHLARWFGPTGCTLGGLRLELRVGGHFHYRMDFPDGGSMRARWRFLEIVPDERLVFELAFTDAHGEPVPPPFDEPWPTLMRVAVTFQDHAGLGRGTVVTLQHSALAASPEEQRTFEANHDSMRQGWGGTFDQLAAFLAARLGT